MAAAAESTLNAPSTQSYSPPTRSRRRPPRPAASDQRPTTPADAVIERPRPIHPFKDVRQHDTESELLIKELR